MLCTHTKKEAIWHQRLHTYEEQQVCPPKPKYCISCICLASIVHCVLNVLEVNCVIVCVIFVKDGCDASLGVVVAFLINEDGTEICLNPVQS